MSRIFLAIDGMAYVFRGYHAVPYMCSRSGVPTNALFGFQRIFKTLMELLEPTHVAVAFDTHEPTFRHKFYPAYKAQRPPAPEDLLAQIPLVKEYLGTMGVKVVEGRGYEADDVLASMAVKAKAQGCKTLIATSDKDLCQMVDDDIFVVRACMNMKDIEVLDKGGVVRHYGVRPDQIVDYLTIVGDSADNVKGVNGLGEKSARDLLAAYGSLDGIYANLDSLKPGQRKKLEEAKGHIEDTRFLIKICTEAPIGGEIADFANPEPDKAAFEEFCRSLDIRSFSIAKAAAAERGQIKDKCGPASCSCQGDLNFECAMPEPKEEQKPQPSVQGELF